MVSFYRWTVLTVTRFTEQYINPELEWPAKAVEAWTVVELAKEELEVIRIDVQVVLASIMNPDRRSTFTDHRQLAQALSHLRKMRTFWSTLLVPGTTEPTGENQLPPEALKGAGTFSVRDWTFSRERRAESRRNQYVTVACQKAATKDRVANRIATYFNTDIKGVQAIRGK